MRDSRDYPYVVPFAVVELLRDSDGTAGAVYGAVEGKWDRIVDREVNDEPAGLDVLLQSALIACRDGVAPCPGAVVGAVRITQDAAVIEGKLPSCMLKSLTVREKERRVISPTMEFRGQENSDPSLVRDVTVPTTENVSRRGFFLGSMNSVVV